MTDRNESAFGHWAVAFFAVVGIIVLLTCNGGSGRVHGQSNNTKAGYFVSSMKGAKNLPLVIPAGSGRVGFDTKSPVDTLPEPVVYAYTFDLKSAKAIDSILMLAMRTTGYELTAKDADGLRNGIALILNTFAYQRAVRDSIRNGLLKTKPLKK